MENKDSMKVFSEAFAKKQTFGSMNEYKAPTFFTANEGEWVPWIDNDGKRWPTKLKSYNNNCALHGGLVEGIVMQICGAGFIYDTSTDLIKAKATEDFLNQINEDGDTLYDIFCQATWDDYVIGAHSIVPIFEANKETIQVVEYFPINNLTASKRDPSTFKIPYWGASFVWDEKGNPVGKPVAIPSFDYQRNKKGVKDYEELVNRLDPQTVKESLQVIDSYFHTNNVQVLVQWHRQDTESFYYPSLPVYKSGLNAIKIDIVSDQFVADALENHLNIDSILTIIGNFSEEQKARMARQIRKQTRDKNRGTESVIFYSESADTAPKLEAFTTNREDKMLNVVNENVEKKILEAHRITSPSLVGIAIPGSLGGGVADLPKAEDIFYKNVIKPLQFRVLKSFNQIMEYNGLEHLTIERLRITDDQTVETKTVKPTVASTIKTGFKKAFSFLKK
jgi:hypothetical protein